MPSSDLELVALLDEVPAFERFPTVDEQISAIQEVAAAAPDRCRIRRVGTSRLGEPIPCLTIEGGQRHALVFGSPHPNEPIGCLAAIHLARAMSENDALRHGLGFTWHVIPCADPDGMRLNEGWFAGPFARTHYARHFYRPAPDEQVEWTFPFSYKKAYFDRVLPETLALMRLIDDLRPQLLCPLHNSELGGVYYYLSEPASGLYPGLHEVARRRGIPLDLGEPEIPYAERLAPAIFRHSTTEDAYDFAERMDLDPLARTAGTSSGAYASRHGTFTLISELPYWTHPDACNEAPAGAGYAGALGRRADGLQDLGERLRAVVEAAGVDMAGGSPLERATRAFIPSILEMAESDRRRAALPETARQATVAEIFSCADLVHCFRLRYGGMLLRALDAEISIGNGTPTIRRERTSFGATYQEWCAEAERVTPADTIPIADVVAVQYGALLLAARYLAG